MSTGPGKAHAGYVGGDCMNNVRVGRDRVEQPILDLIRKELLAPARIKLMAQEMCKLFCREHEA